MAETISNMRLEYAPNTLIFFKTDDAGTPLPFDADTTFDIERIDDPTAYIGGTVSFGSVTDSDGQVIDNAVVSIVISPSNPGKLYVDGDELHNHGVDTFIHIYALRSLASNTVYLAGKVQLYAVAGI